MASTFDEASSLGMYTSMVIDEFEPEPIPYVEPPERPPIYSIALVEALQSPSTSFNVNDVMGNLERHPADNTLKIYKLQGLQYDR